MEKPKSPGNLVGNVPEPSNLLPKTIIDPMTAVVGTAKAMPLRKTFRQATFGRKENR